MNKTTFMWAQSTNANLQEPIKELAEKGWQHRDIPKASNMNWIFKQISDEFSALRKDLELQKIELEEKSAQIIQQNKRIAEQQISIQQHKDMLKDLNNEHLNLKKFTKSNFDLSSQRDNFSVGISRQICMMLRGFTANIRAIHPNIPEYPWPLRDEVGLREISDDTFTEELG